MKLGEKLYNNLKDGIENGDISKKGRVYVLLHAESDCWFVGNDSKRDGMNCDYVYEIDMLLPRGKIKDILIEKFSTEEY